MEERCTEIERANRILLERMTNIMTTNKSPPPKKNGSKSAEKMTKKQSLNKNMRQVELNRIT